MRAETAGFARIGAGVLVAGAIGLMLSSLARADAWLDSGDSALRHHVQYLVDSGVIDMPVTAWPIPSADMAAALGRVKDRDTLSGGELASLRYVERRIEPLKQDPTRATLHASGAARPIHLRTFESTPRQEGEVGASFSIAGSNVSARLSVAVVVDPDDHQQVRLDGTYGSMRVGNWIVTAGALDRWWGGGWDGSLILSSNARPVPALSLDRESSEAFESPWLSWIGPWRISTFMGHMESDRRDRDHPLLFGMRVMFRPFNEIEIGSVKPFDGLEFALERTAQWCAEGLPCGASAFWDVFSGNDNAGENVDPEQEPGNQLAGWSLRWASPWKYLPLAFYRQKTGETIDLDSPLPRRTLDLYGLETWGGTSAGYTWRVHAEYANSACSHQAGQTVRLYDCAYNNALFPIEGYRYRGRSLGHSIDGDGISRSLGVLLTTPRDWSVSLLVRSIDVNRGGGVPDTRHTVFDRPTDLWNVETAVAVRSERGTWSIGLGVDQVEDVATERQERAVRGFAEWRLGF